jgi:hypothetical protein
LVARLNNALPVKPRALFQTIHAMRAGGLLRAVKYAIFDAGSSQNVRKCSFRQAVASLARSLRGRSRMALKQVAAIGWGF